MTLDFCCMLLLSYSLVNNGFNILGTLFKLLQYSVLVCMKVQGYCSFVSMQRYSHMLMQCYCSLLLMQCYPMRVILLNNNVMLLFSLLLPMHCYRSFLLCWPGVTFVLVLTVFFNVHVLTVKRVVRNY